MREYRVTWWNVENLFDVEDSPARSQKLRDALGGELQGWNEAVLGQKIGQLASILLQVHGGAGPDLLGVCEVENQPVLERLVAALGPLGKNYEIAHHDTADGRGIDVAFIYDADVLTKVDQFYHVILKRSATRDLFQVNFRTQQDRLLVAIGNHWPSRTGGTYESEPYRILAAETLGYWMQRIAEIHGRDTPVLVMGDFNDEPFDRSMTEYALSTRTRAKVLNANSPRLLNLMWEAMGARAGTHYFDNFPSVLDQMLASRGFLPQASPWQVVDGSLRIETFPEMVADGTYPAPIRFGRPSQAGGHNPQGFSDHFPLSVRIREAD